jgi:translation initiation factor IF-3
VQRDGVSGLGDVGRRDEFGKEFGTASPGRDLMDLEDIGLVESMPKLEGKRMIMFLIPKKKK